MTQSQLPIRVIKVGGSLLLDPSLPNRLNKFITESLGHRHAVVAGGGKLVDCIRQLQTTHGDDLTDEFCHWSAIRMMSENARVLNQLLPQLPIAEPASFASSRAESCILDCVSFTRTNSRLTKSWDSTSDSIAAELATELGANELWLFKSILPASPNMTSWQSDEIVDAGFFSFAGRDSLPFDVFIARASDDEMLFVQGV